MKLQDLKTKAELFEIANKEVDQPTLNIHITLQDKEVLDNLEKLATKITRNISKFQIGIAFQ